MALQAGVAVVLTLEMAAAVYLWMATWQHLLQSSGTLLLVGLASAEVLCAIRCPGKGHDPAEEEHSCLASCSPGIHGAAADLAALLLLPEQRCMLSTGAVVHHIIVTTPIVL